MSRVIGDSGVDVGSAAGVVDGFKKNFALGQSLAVHSISECKRWRGEVQRFGVLAVDVKWIVLEAESSGELAGACVGRAAGLGGQRDDLRQLRMLRSALANDGAHVRRVRGVRPAVVAFGAKSEVRHVAGEVVIIAGVMVAGGAAKIRDRSHDGEVFALFGGEREMLANVHARRSGLDGSKRAAVFHRRLGFHIPHINVRRATAEKKQDGGLGRLRAPASQIGLRSHHRGAKLQTAQSGS